ncbi:MULTISPECIES: IS91 family transposase [Weeksellaceae]|nr:MULTISPECIES: IS91 family transposase [Weeksellaceae]QIG89735.1 IS91 family transposase [Chryseobacterium sp. POL2]
MSVEVIEFKSIENQDLRFKFNEDQSLKSKYEVADVLNILGSKLENLELNSWQLRTLFALKKCRTSALGGHIDACDECGNVSISYNSCRNRHCPKCQGKNREKWIGMRENELLPVPYFHVVFTLPDVLNKTVLHEPKMLYDILFESAWETLQAFGNNRGLKMGMIAILHTWGQNLSLHPHLHCIVPGGGVDGKGNWQRKIKTDKYLFAVKALSKVFRAKYVALLRKEKLADAQVLQSLFEKNWVVYAKRPFGGPKQVIEYLGRYTHKVAISNHRIKNVSDHEVTIAYKDYKDGSKTKQLTLKNEEFARRFSLHILPKRFVRIRHYGIVSSSWKRGKLQQLQKELKIVRPKIEPKTQHKKCYCCKVGNLITLHVFGQRGPPKAYLIENKLALVN